MPYVPGCRWDLFVSYASENNRDGWVERFVDALGNELEELLGRHFSKGFIFLDKTRLRVGQSLPEELQESARESAVLVPLLSPSYLTSDWCDRERTAFFQRLPHGAKAEQCLASIIVRIVPQSSLTSLFRSAHHFLFLNPDEQNPWSSGSPEWIRGVRDFATQLTQVLQQLRRNCRPVFLGRASGERARSVRERSVRELEQRHFRVVPEGLQEFEDEAALQSMLQESALAVHFLGGADDWSLSAIEHSVRHCNGATVLYQPFGVQLSAAERLWLDEFEKQLAARTAYYRLPEKNEQELLAFLLAEIGRVETPQVAQQSSVSIICEEQDLHIAHQLRTQIKRHDQMEVQYPAFLQDRTTAMERTRKWNELVQGSQALLFCWGESDERRLQRVWELAETVKPSGRRAWYVVPPDVEVKLQKRPDSICQYGEFDYRILESFLAPLRQGGTTP